MRHSWIIGPTMDKRKVSNVLGEGVFCQRMNPLSTTLLAGGPSDSPKVWDGSPSLGLKYNAVVQKGEGLLWI